MNFQHCSEQTTNYLAAIVFFIMAAGLDIHKRVLITNFIETKIYTHIAFI